MMKDPIDAEGRDRRVFYTQNASVKTLRVLALAGNPIRGLTSAVADVQLSYYFHPPLMKPY